MYSWQYQTALPVKLTFISLLQRKGCLAYNIFLVLPVLKENGEGVINIDLEGVHTNLVLFEVTKPGLSPVDFINRLQQVSWFFTLSAPEATRSQIIFIMIL